MPTQLSLRRPSAKHRAHEHGRTFIRQGTEFMKISAGSFPVAMDALRGDRFTTCFCDFGQSRLAIASGASRGVPGGALRSCGERAAPEGLLTNGDTLSINLLSHHAHVCSARQQMGNGRWEGAQRGMAGGARRLAADARPRRGCCHAPTAPSAICCLVMHTCAQRDNRWETGDGRAQSAGWPAAQDGSRRTRGRGEAAGALRSPPPQSVVSPCTRVLSETTNGNRTIRGRTARDGRRRKTARGERASAERLPPRPDRPLRNLLSRNAHVCSARQQMGNGTMGGRKARDGRRRKMARGERAAVERPPARSDRPLRNLLSHHAHMCTDRQQIENDSTALHLIGTPRHLLIIVQSIAFRSLHV
jgi:hypothetical protein